MPLRAPSTRYDRQPQFAHPGGHTAYGSIVDYRLSKLREHNVLHGDWLDVGCAEGYWSVGLAERGADSVIGIDSLASRITDAQSLPHPRSVTFAVALGERLPFAANSFDGVLLNEVLEHVENESATLREIARVLRPNGHLALFSPNRWFPFEGHGAYWREDQPLWPRPVPLMPWLPATLTRRFAAARNYWPGELRRLVSSANLHIVYVGWALIQFAQYRWLPEKAVQAYLENISRIENSRLARFLAVSVFVLATPRSGTHPRRDEAVTPHPVASSQSPMPVRDEPPRRFES